MYGKCSPPSGLSLRLAALGEQEQVQVTIKPTKPRAPNGDYFYSRAAGLQPWGPAPSPPADGSTIQLLVVNYNPRLFGSPGKGMCYNRITTLSCEAQL